VNTLYSRRNRNEYLPRVLIDENNRKNNSISPRRVMITQIYVLLFRPVN